MPKLSALSYLGIQKESQNGAGSIVAPTVLATAAAGGAGSVTAGVHVYGYTWVTPLGESVMSPLSAPFTASGSTVVTVTLPTTGAPAGTTNINIYRSIAGTTAPMLLSGTVSYPTATYSDTKTDALLVNPRGDARFIPVRNPTIHDAITYYRDLGFRGSPAQQYGTYAGPVAATAEWEGDLFGVDTPILFHGLFGNDAVTGAGPYTHTLTLAAAPPTFALLDGIAGQETRQYGGTVVQEVAVRYNAAEALTYQARLMGFKSVLMGFNAAVNFDTNPPFLGWEATALIGGGSILRMSAFDLTFTRPVEIIMTAQGTQVPYRIFPGPLSVSGNITFIWEDDTELNHYLNNDQPSLLITVTEPSSGPVATFQLSKPGFTTGNVNRGKTYAEMAASIEGNANATDGTASVLSPAKLTFTNLQQAAY